MSNECISEQSKLNANSNRRVALVHYRGSLYIPEEMGLPSKGQMNGTTEENLAELACRICYDSLGRGRDSLSLHKHILEVKHHSIYEHVWFHFLIKGPINYFYLTNIKHLIVDYKVEGTYITCNLRHLIEESKKDSYKGLFWSSLASFVSSKVPNILKQKTPVTMFFPGGGSCELPTSLFNPLNEIPISFFSPSEEHTIPVTLFMKGSRCFSHEQIRHRTNISQRSSRYCDEDYTPWAEHPLIEKYGIVTEDFIEQSRKLYRQIVTSLEAALKADGVDQAKARKQARGAARGYLGNALQTQMIVTASVGHWREMIEQRLTEDAEAEIRYLYSDVLDTLKSLGYLKDIETTKSPDGLGVVILKRTEDAEKTK